MRYIILCLISFVAHLPASAQESSAILAADSAVATTGNFEKLQAKNRSRIFSNVPSPGGEHYVYLDDYDLSSGREISPEIRVHPETRAVTTVINTFTPNRVSLKGQKAAIGTVRLLGASSAARKIDLKTTLKLQHPLRVRVRERARTELK